MDERDASKEHFVKLLYSGILKRAPDDAGMSSHLAKLGQDPTFSSALSVLESFVGSNENRNVRSIKRTSADPLQLPVDSIMSIGSHCLTSATLKRSGLKRFSGPFDWIFSNLAMVADCIEDDFTTFLDKRFYSPVPLDKRKEKDANFCDHAFFRDRYALRFIFNHSDPNEDQVYQYLVRCVGRFRALLSSAGRNILFGVCAPDRGHEADFDRLCDLLNRAPACELLIVICEPPSGTLNVRFMLSRASGRHRLFVMQPTSDLGPLRFESSFDDYMIHRLLDSLLYSYPLEHRNSAVGV